MATLDIKVTTGHIETYEALLLQLGDPAAVEPVDRLNLEFGDTHQAFPTAFGLLAAYVARVRDPRSRPLVSRKFGANPHSAKLERMMDNIGFIDAVGGRETARKPAAGITPLTRITADTEPTALAESVIDIITDTAQPTRDAKESIFVLVSEVVENVQRHARQEGPALMCGQLSAQKRKLELCFIDTGVGVKKSMLDGKNQAAVRRVDAGESSLSVALEPFVSSTGEDATAADNGMGLFVASEYARQTRGMFRLTSGNETVIVSKEGEKTRMHAMWPGTVLNLLLNINRVGSIAEVYRELPLVRGQHDRFLPIP